MEAAVDTRTLKSSMRKEQEYFKIDELEVTKRIDAWAKKNPELAAQIRKEVLEEMGIA